MARTAKASVNLARAVETTDYVRFDENPPEGTRPLLGNIRVDKRSLVSSFGGIPPALRVGLEVGVAPGSAIEA